MQLTGLMVMLYKALDAMRHHITSLNFCDSSEPILALQRESQS